jgi:sarcosine oxidase subunit gamma
MLRLLSWSPEHGKRSTPVMLAGRALPAEVGMTLLGEVSFLCVTPAEWLIVSSALDARQMQDELEADLANQNLVLADLSEALVSFEVTGPHACDLLAQSCSVDFHPSRFRAGQCARTRLAQIPVVVAAIDATPKFELTVARSYAAYLQAYLQDAVQVIQGTR